MSTFDNPLIGKFIAAARPESGGISQRILLAAVIILAAAAALWHFGRIKPASPNSSAAPVAIPVPKSVEIPSPPLPPASKKTPAIPPQRESRHAPSGRMAPHGGTPQKTPVAAPRKTQASVPPAPSKPLSPRVPAVSAPLPPAATPPPAPELQEWFGNDTSVKHPGEVVIRNDRQWIMFWAEHHPHEAAPDLDFARFIVVGVFAGPRPADEFSIRMEQILATSKSLTVEYRERLPPPGTFAVNVTVYPYHLKAIPKTTLPVKFKKLAVIDPSRS